MKKSLLIGLVLALSACSGAEDEAANNTATNNTATNNTATNNTATNNTATNNIATNNSATNNVQNTIPAGSVVINEVVAAGTPDWVELYNTTAQSVDLSGAYITDLISNPTKAQLPAGTIVAAGGYLVLDIDDTTFGFKLGSDEEFAIFAQDGQTLIDSVDWAEGQSPSGGSYGRVPNATGEFATITTPTPGSANVATTSSCGNGILEGNEVCDGQDLGEATCLARGFESGELSCDESCTAFVEDGCVAAVGEVVINEVTSSGDDQIELYNKGNATVDISGWFVGDDGFDLANIDEAKRYVFPAGTSLDAGAFRVLTKNTEHTFGVGNSDALTLYNDASVVVDTVSWAAGEAQLSYCRMPDGGAFEVCATQTFGASN